MNVVDSKDLIGIVPARGGSKGLRAKNLYPLDGRPLIEYTLRTLESVAAIGQIIVSSDNDEILEFCRDFGGRILPVRRRTELALDHTTTDEVLADLLGEKLADGSIEQNTIVVLAQPTSPLRTPRSIERALELHRSNPRRAKMVMSVVRSEKHPYKSCTMQADGMLQPAIDADSLFAPRQALPASFHPNGAIYLFRVRDFMVQSCLPRNGIYGLEMSPEESIDIDTLSDVAEAEAILRQGAEE